MVYVSEMCPKSSICPVAYQVRMNCFQLKVKRANFTVDNLTANWWQEHL